jgi:hypothetical protein
MLYEPNAFRWRIIETSSPTVADPDNLQPLRSKRWKFPQPSSASNPRRTLGAIEPGTHENGNSIPRDGRATRRNQPRDTEIRHRLIVGLTSWDRERRSWRLAGEGRKYIAGGGWRVEIPLLIASLISSVFLQTPYNRKHRTNNTNSNHGYWKDSERDHDASVKDGRYDRYRSVDSAVCPFV